MTPAERFREILSRVAYKGWDFHVGQDESRCYLQVRFPTTCTYAGTPCVAHGRKWLLSPHMTVSEVVTTAMKAVLTAEEHEARERFRYRGRVIFGPHIDVEALVWLCEREGGTDARPDFDAAEHGASR